MVASYYMSSIFLNWNSTQIKLQEPMRTKRDVAIEVAMDVIYHCEMENCGASEESLGRATVPACLTEGGQHVPAQRTSAPRANVLPP